MDQHTVIYTTIENIVKSNEYKERHLLMNVIPPRTTNNIYSMNDNDYTFKKI